MADINKVLTRRGLKANLPTLSAGEIGYTTDTRETFIGTGSGNVNMGGSHWYRGTAMSGTSTTANAYSYAACPEVKVDDIYMNTSNGNIYACTTAGKGTAAKWTYQGCMKGPQGATGATGAAGADGQDLQAVYSTTPTQVGTWIDGSAIYRIVWSFTSEKCRSNINYIVGNITDLPNCPFSSCTMLVNECYIMIIAGGVENVVVADRQQLKTLVSSSDYSSQDFTIYAIVEYIPV